MDQKQPLNFNIKPDVIETLTLRQIQLLFTKMYGADPDNRRNAELKLYSELPPVELCK